jgi:hypothetical protein
MATAQLTWLDLTAADRDKIRRVLTLFNEQGTVDELGLGSLRDTLSNALFPGTSVLHTRLRYVLFIPWAYQEIESWGGGHDVADEARQLEVELVEALARSADTRGIIGIQAGRSLARLASTSYWALLVRLGIFVPGMSQSWYHTHFDALVRQRNEVARADDPGVTWSREPTWHPRLPSPPEGFPDGVSFALTDEEADFVLGRIEDRCAGTLLAWLAREGSTDLEESLWHEPLIEHTPKSIAEIVELARRFSLHVEGAPLLYNLLLAELRYELQANENDAKLMDHYRARLAEWAAYEAEEAPFLPDTLWLLAARQGTRLVTPQQRFVEAWTRRLTEIGPAAVAEDAYLRDLIATRERQLKGDQRARVVNRGRLLDWSGNVGTGRMQFRWPQVRQLLTDLHAGLNR